MKRAHIVAASAFLILVGCATPEVMQATGGSRADGTVDLSYEYGIFQQPIVDMNAAIVTATNRCQAWGYTAAEPFGGQINHCNQMNGYGQCLDMLVTVKYQCTGGGPH
jgi:hypothetical protein